MAGHQCLRCRAALRQSTYIHQTLTTCKRQTRSYNSKKLATPKDPTKARYSFKNPLSWVDTTELLSKPTWSVRSLLPPSTDADLTAPSTSRTSTSDNNTTSPTSGPTANPTPTITASQLHHLLRLSALPQPSSAAEEASMLSTLETQLHFVRCIQSVDTQGVEPLVTIRDETEEGVKEATIGLQHPSIKEALAMEVRVGKMGRVRRRREGVKKEGEGGERDDRRDKEEREWDPLKGTEGRTVGRYFVVDSGDSGREPRVAQENEGA